MKTFLKYTLATITGIIITSILFFIIMMAVISTMMASGEKAVSIKDNSILVLKAGLPIPDRASQNPFASLDFSNIELTPSVGLNEILRNIDKASRDKKIKGILIENGLLPTGWATTQEIRNALRDFKSSGKFIISYSDYSMRQEGYYLSSIADRIYISPGTVIDFKGLSAEIMFYKKALDKLGIEVQVVRHGKFKGAVEPFMLDELSDANKLQIKDYTGSIWENVIEEISSSRNIPAADLNRMADSLQAFLASSALKHRLVDGLLFRDELNDTLKSLSGIEKKEDLRIVSMKKYTKVPDEERQISVKNRIAVIYASGTIVMGKGNENNIGGDHFAEVIRKQRKDSSVKAIVLRVNSPGGNAVASDMMWRELDLAASVKPVVVSMGNYAASGGYYISAPGTKIFADPVTISGSIGVFGLIPNAGKLLDQKLGISTESVNTNRYSDFPAIYRPMDNYEKVVMQSVVESTYADFVSKVAKGRKMDSASVDSIGQGRVWSGARCIKIGLVDELGGLNDAIKEAVRLANVDKYSIRELPELEDPLTAFLKNFNEDVRMNILKKDLGQSIRFFNELNELKNLSGVQARLPYFLEIN
jgi:protease-4